MVPSRPALALALLVLAAPARAQDAPPDAEADPATELLHAAYSEVLAGEALDFAFSLTIEAPAEDSAYVETGWARTFVDPETEEARFWIEFDEGEVSVAALDGVAYQVAFPRTQRVYADSTFEEVDEDTAGLLRFHPAFGVDLFYFAQRAPGTVVGPDAVGGRPCTRVAYAHPDLSAAASACYDDAVALPSEVVLEGSDGTLVQIVVSEVGLAGPPAEGDFTIATPEGYARVPYDGSAEPLIEVSAPAPPFALSDDVGGAVSLADVRGRYVLLDFWGTWCAPCVEAIPHVEEIAQAYPDLAVLALASHEYAEDDPTAFVRERGGTYPVLRADDATVEAYRVRAFPTYVVVDPTGAVAFVGVPDRDPEAGRLLDAFLAGVYGGGAAGSAETARPDAGAGR